MKECAIVAAGIVLALAVAIVIGTCIACDKPPRTNTPPIAAACDASVVDGGRTEPDADLVIPIEFDAGPDAPAPEADAAPNAAKPSPACLPTGKPFRATVIIKPEC